MSIVCLCFYVYVVSHGNQFVFPLLLPMQPFLSDAQLLFTEPCVVAIDQALHQDGAVGITSKSAGYRPGVGAKGGSAISAYRSNTWRGGLPVSRPWLGSSFIPARSTSVVPQPRFMPRYGGAATPPLVARLSAVRPAIVARHSPMSVRSVVG
jgi:hypothetical protein